ncbi:thioesterase family protein [Tepidiforma sp.]|uniref:thioesterase family protein n=1 Tax=Tepidiforma sp. TaxID=2682230 RepID=UPI002ADD7698|nr:thioesterase family protein [Tepidiforma sp.]
MAEFLEHDPFFAVEGDAFVPRPVCRGPWDPNSLHGRVVAGLLGAEAEHRHAEPRLRVARMTVDLWRLPGFDPITVTTNVRREGSRIRVVDAEAFAAGQSIGRASVVFLRETAQPEGQVWSPPPWDFPLPDALPPEPLPPVANEGWRPMWESRSQGRAFGAYAQKRLWMREVRPLVAGRPLTPFQRVALACDFTSPLANSGTIGLAYINVDITLYLHRYPAGEWIGFETTDHGAADGIAMGQCRLYDEQGPIGSSVVAALAQRRRA